MHKYSISLVRLLILVELSSLENSVSNSSKVFLKPLEQQENFKTVQIIFKKFSFVYSNLFYFNIK